MRGVAFTLDALFALILTTIIITLILYVRYVPQTNYALGVSGSGATLSALASTNVSAIAGGSPIAAEMVNQQAGSGEVWPQFMDNQYGSGSNQYGPIAPFVSASFTASNTIATPIVADYGNIYFGTTNTIYAVTANGTQLWTVYSGTPIQTAPALSNGELVYANATNITAVNAYTGTLIWTTNVVSGLDVVTPVLIYTNLILVGAVSGGSDKIYSLYVVNGTVRASFSPGAHLPYSSTINNGELIESEAPEDIIAIGNINGESMGMLWYSVQKAALTNVATVGNMIAYGTGSTLNLTYLNGSAFYSASAGGTVLGVATYKQYAVYQTADGIIEVPDTGAGGWSVTPAQTAASGIPAVSSTTVYTIWNNNYLMANNLTTGAALWSVKIPYATQASPYLTLAYGKLYVTDGSTVIAYGACNANPTLSVLAAATSLYVNGDGSCATSLIDSVSNMQGYGVFVNNGKVNSQATYAPADEVASFNGANSIVTTGGGHGALLQLSISFWMKPSNPTGGAQYPIDSNPEGTWRIGFTAANSFLIDPGTASDVAVPYNVVFNQWQFVTLTAEDSLDNVVYSLYVNQTKVATGKIAGSDISAISTLVFSSQSYPYNGQLANVQVYDAYLSQQQEDQLYQEGIGGGPLQLAGVISWFPLDGDTNDYVNQSTSGYPLYLSYTAGNYMPSGLETAYEVSKETALIPARNISAGKNNLYNIGVYEWR
jgi:hypothetical protein